MVTLATSAPKLDTYRDLARQLRADSIRCSTAAGSGHPSSSLSAADLMAVLLAGHLRYDWAKPRDLANDHLIFSKGHASPLNYALLRAAGAIDDAELMTFRRLGSRLQGHPTPVLPWIDVATGSLGQGLPIGVGIALAGARVLHADYRVWILVGDSETAEGSIWEAFDHAGHEGLSNLTAILDINRLGQRGPTELEWDTAAYARRVEAFGWDALVIDGHDVAAIDDAYARARSAERPTAIVAKTIKGKGVSFIEDKEGWHGKALDADQAKLALAELGAVASRTFETKTFQDALLETRAPTGAAAKVAEPTRATAGAAANVPQPTPTVVLKTYTELVATRKAYGEALASLGVLPDVVVLDAEVSNSTHAEDFKKAYPERFFEMYIAEQQMIAAAVGMQVVGLRPFASTFAAFFTRAYDFVRMAAISRANIRLSGSHAGVSIGEDGPSQMALEDLAMMRAVHGSTVLYPCDANQTAQLVRRMADRQGICYIRTTREKTPILYGQDATFQIGGSAVVRGGGAEDQAAIVAAGITVHEAAKAADLLKDTGISVRVIDCYSVKPIDAGTLADAVEATGGQLVVVEDHWPEGGLGDAVLAALSEAGVFGQLLGYRHLAVREMPGSGKPAELLAAAGLDAAHIVSAVRELL